MKKIITTIFVCVIVLSLSITSVFAVGEGPNWNGKSTVNGSMVISYEDMVSELKKAEKKSSRIELEKYGESVRGRALYLVKFGDYNPNKPTVAFMTQQHGNEVLSTEAALEVIKTLSNNSKEVRDWAEKMNIFFLPRYNPDGGAGDVSGDISHYAGGGLATRYNYNMVDLNRDHVDRNQPETKGLYENVLGKYKIDYFIDFHHQGANARLNGELASGSMLYPTNPAVDPDIVEASKRLGAVVYNAVNSKGWGLVTRYNGGTALTMARNQVPLETGSATLLFEMRGMLDHEIPSYILGQKSNGYLIQQSVVSMESVIRAVADGSINTIDTSIWDTMPLPDRN